MSDLLSGLNAQQLEAVRSTEGYIRVIAGAGSGKTRALAHRFAFLVNEIGILPSHILCVTFTNKSANEMKQRIRRLTGENDTGYISTFHSFCVTVLQEDINAVRYPKSFLVLDNADIDQMLKIIYEERSLTLRDRTFGEARDMIEIRKTIKQPDYYCHLIQLSLEELRRRYLDAVEADDVIFWGYLYQQKKCFGLDYNDLIVFTLYIFNEDEGIRLKWQKRLEYIMVDEFQDIDALQYRLMSVLCGYHRNLFVVGDPDQTIYTWRGADVRFLLDFDKQFPGTKTVMMNINYRSTPQILAAANSLIAHNAMRIKKDLTAVKPAGDKPLCHHAKNTEAEARWIAYRVRDLTDAGTQPGDIAVLYRAHFVSRSVEEVFLKEGVPYKIYSGVQFFGRAEIKDAIAYLRLVAYKDDLSFRRVANNPKRNIGDRRMKFIEAAAARDNLSLYEAFGRLLDDEIFLGTKAKQFHALIERYAARSGDMPVSELLGALLDESGYETALRTQGSHERLDNLAELKQAVYEFETSCGEESKLEDYLAHVSLMTNTDTAFGGGAVKLMTVHSAKGLEFPYVFICGLNEGIFPSKKTMTAQAMEEERRLAFVAVTRAERGLCLSEAEGRNHDGTFRYPSRFILNVEPSLLEYTERPDERFIAESKRLIEACEKAMEARDQGPAFQAGDRVVHAIMGEGEIVEVDRDAGAYVIQFDLIHSTRRIRFGVTLEPARG
ncbi:MAG TPA: UvrD-helicase domain-containing protein [Clostridiales bacterium]|nr:MAG: ATP-dependent DNA helicase PcrA [Firmicutes bacterium ADurb.Bin262]HOU10106.1 UvrD-helicase domain-containing protein [Clostridiales bacterium]HQK72214.1 UvrD-helicase domain-containing protein [Clostridiales bacterium]